MTCSITDRQRARPTTCPLFTKCISRHSQVYLGKKSYRGVELLHICYCAVVAEFGSSFHVDLSEQILNQLDLVLANG